MIWGPVARDDPGFLDDRHPPVNLIAHKLTPSLPFLATVADLASAARDA